MIVNNVNGYLSTMNKVERSLLYGLVQRTNAFADDMSGLLYAENLEQLDAHKTYGSEHFNQMVGLINELSRLNQQAMWNDLKHRPRCKKEPKSWLESHGRRQ
jgi:hypothetical protein